MACLISPVMKLRRLSSADSRRFAYRNLSDDDMEDSVIRVVVGKEKKEFMVEPYVLEETPFRVLIGSAKDRTQSRFNRTGRVVWLDHVDSILFEHLLWLLRNDASSFSDMDVAEIIEFYAQDC
ncbi:hypothetical protein Bca4012_029432 [Brassica carinata]|uniref:Uncharacterized protein n=3 Tax=Brassica TaxID=3705 RepID=A0A8X7RK97_BRACI|nr:PREDICTED: uncharacterized protein LOC106337075 [Brassica oleracea var. oleracea]XP_013631560.1 PREDICTED: uncharacterized protein LOC106337075 [Brassica oleracea var. oleracea]XP_013631561.1 PREDICTED: uncharacterized protein LOC106337075 [Brassica oleracea var. oleracea]XP_022556496.1 auxin-responsive protein SAUR78 [Brassica napus]KAG2289497.1 hypothetical protein Bca52824_049101 [Brassica carinata]KAG2326725.1 hypothetical protein Bca52824_009453 [Brassica carinata]KAG2326730.1 hypothe